MAKKVMIIDDDADITASLSAVLEMEGYQIQTAHKPEEIFPKIFSFNPDVILLDYLLSGTDGREICIKIKNSDRTNKIPIIMMSAHPQASILIKGSGANDFIAKPFDIDDIIDCVGQYSQS